MNHFLEAIKRTETIGEILSLVKSIETPEDGQIFLTEAATYALSLRIGGATSLEMSKLAMQDILARAALIEGEKTLRHVERILNFTYRSQTVGDLAEIVLAIIGRSCPGCPNCRPDKFDENIITVEGHTVSEEPLSGASPRQLLPKSP